MPPPYVAITDKIILFDGVCVLCNAWARFIIRVDTQQTFKLATVQSPEGHAILAYYNMPTNTFDTMLLVEGDQLFTHSTAFIQVVKQLGFPWSIAALNWIIPKPIRDRLYSLVAKHRYRIFGQYEQCTMPTPDHLRRIFTAPSEHTHDQSTTTS